MSVGPNTANRPTNTCMLVGTASRGIRLIYDMSVGVCCEKVCRTTGCFKVSAVRAGVWVTRLTVAVASTSNTRRGWCVYRVPMTTPICNVAACPKGKSVLVTVDLGAEPNAGRSAHKNAVRGQPEIGGRREAVGRSDCRKKIAVSSTRLKRTITKQPACRWR